jgi:hypothetical protein
MSTQNNVAIQGATEITLSEERKAVTIARTKSGKAKSGKQLARTLLAEKRKATNDAGKLLVSAMKEQLHSLPILRQIFKDLEYVWRKNEETGKMEMVKDSQGLPLLGESSKFCEALNYETGKALLVDDILAIPMRKYLDYITEIEATRQHVRGITIAEFRSVIVRYYRGERKNVVKLESSASEILRQYTRNTDI